MIRVVTVAREYGSGGAATARTLAQQLGWRLLDRALIDEVARSAHWPPEVAARLDEHLDRWTHRLVKSLLHGGFEGVSSVTDEDLVDADRMAALTRRVIEEAATIGDCVIVGRGGQCILAGRPDTLHVFVYASRAERARRLEERLGQGADVEAAIDAADREREGYVRRHFGRDWADRRLYDLMVSSDLGDATVVATILAAAGRAPTTS